MKMRKKCLLNRGTDAPGINLFFFGVRMVMLGFILFGISGFLNEVTLADQPLSSFKEEVKKAIKKLSACFMDPLSKSNIDAIHEELNKIISDAEKEGKPLRYGIGVLDKNGIAVTGKYIIGIFKEEDFSKYKFVRKAFKKKKIVQDRLYLQDSSELLIICAPLVQRKKVLGAIVLGFNPTELKKEYALDIQQFLTLDFNK
jgi:hypothetical protein